MLDHHPFRNCRSELTGPSSAAPFISFHSNHAFLKDPPADYRSHSGTSGVDLLAGLADVRQKVKSRGYKSQYEFTAELEQLVRIRLSFARPGLTETGP